MWLDNNIGREKKYGGHKFVNVVGLQECIFTCLTKLTVRRLAKMATDKKWKPENLCGICGKNVVNLR
jgi:hypothetical protein